MEKQRKSMESIFDEESFIEGQGLIEGGLDRHADLAGNEEEQAVVILAEGFDGNNVGGND